MWLNTAHIWLELLTILQMSSYNVKAEQLIRGMKQEGKRFQK